MFTVPGSCQVIYSFMLTMFFLPNNFNNLLNQEQPNKTCTPSCLQGCSAQMAEDRKNPYFANTSILLNLTQQRTL